MRQERLVAAVVANLLEHLLDRRVEHAGRFAALHLEARLADLAPGDPFVGARVLRLDGRGDEREEQGEGREANHG